MKKMRKMKRRRMAMLLVLAMLLCAVPVSRAEAASKAYMKKLNVSWDLENNKAVTVHTKYAGLSKLQTMTVKMTKYKVTNAKKKGYKKLTFTLTFNKTFEPTAKQVHKMANSSHYKSVEPGYGAGGYIWYDVIDYKTGKSLKAENDLGVKVKFSNVTGVGTWYRYEDNDGCYVVMKDKVKVKCTITYPKDYTGLCIEVGGHASLKQTSADRKYQAGKTTFGKTTYYSKKDNMVAHFMRVN